MRTDPQQLHRSSTSSTSVTSSSSSLYADQLLRSASPVSTSADRNKASGACSSCRRSKVKCDHDGAAPCKRCRNGGYECIFKSKELGSTLQQDEWRARTDETLTKLVSAMSALVEQEEHSSKRRRIMGQDWSEESTALRTPSASTSMIPSRQTFYTGAGSHILSQSTRATGESIARIQSHAVLASGDRTWGNAINRSSSNVGGSSRISSIIPTFSYVTDLLHQNSGLSNSSSSERTSNGSSNQPMVLPSKTNGSLPLPILNAQRSGVYSQALHPTLVARASRYRYPDPSLGSNDPRLDAIRLGLLSSHEARFLFSLYAKTIEPFGFGFPDFPASSELTPVLLSAVTSVASPFSPSLDLRSRQWRLRNDVLGRTLPYAPSTAEDEFNPESGIGTEEVVGACIWSSYQGSIEAWKVARAARWWSEKYSYETGPHAGLTVGEMVAILPPVRHVSMQDRVRVWLSAFLAELHQCEIHSKEPIMQLIDPAQYGQSLMSASSGVLPTKQDAALVFHSRVAYLVSKSNKYGDSEGLLQASRELTASWCTTRELLATDSDKKDTYDHAIDLDYSLAKASVLIRACRIHQEQTAENTSGERVSSKAAEFISVSQACQNACMDSMRLLVSPNAHFVGNLAALPSIYHFWIARCAVFLLELCIVDRLHYRLGLLVEGQIDDILGTVGGFMQQYLVELSACSTTISIEEQKEAGTDYDIIKHPAMDAALAVASHVAGVQATA